MARAGIRAGRRASGGASAFGATTVRRDRILDLLERSRSARVVCLQAPGGYGKTTVLTQWAAEDGRPVLWLTVRPQAADAQWVARAIVEALEESGLVGQRAALPEGSDAVTWHLGVLPALETVLASAQRPFVIVIDDAGALSGEKWNCLAGSIATSLPEGAQLALGTRTMLPPSLRRLRRADQVLVIGPGELALDAVEGAELMRMLQADLTDDRLMSLLQDTEGWPVTVHLAGRAISAGRSVEHRLDLTPDGELSDYLREEILRRLDREDARFLLRSSVLTELDEPACDAVTGSDASLARLRRLAGSNHLLVPLDSTASRFRMHPLLAGVLDDELRATDPRAWHDAHAAASRCREAAGDLDSAVFHAVQAGDDARLAALVWGHAGRLIGAGRMPVVQRWLDGVSMARLTSHAGLALTAAWIAVQVGDDLRMGQLALAAQARAVGDQSSLMADVGLLKAAMTVDGLDAMETLVRQFIAAKGPDEEWLTVAHYLLGVALVLKEQPEQGRAELERADRLSRLHGFPAMRARCLAALSEQSLARGDTRRASEYIVEAREALARYRLDHITTSAPVFVASARCSLAQGRPAEARDEARQALRLTSLMRVLGPLNEVYSRLALANLFLALGDHAQAVVLLADAQAAYGPANRSPLGDRMMAETLQRLRTPATRPSGSPVLTTAEVRVLQYLPTHLSFPEIAAELFVSRHTVKTQALSSYRKLGAHTRSEAIAKARELGLLPSP